MSRPISPWEVEKQWLLHPSVHDKVPPGHLAHFVCDAVRELFDLDAIVERYEGNIAYSRHYPAMMTALLCYSYSEGFFASRRIARACEQRVDYMALTAMELVPFEDVRRFREAHYQDLVGLLTTFFLACHRLRLPWGPDSDDPGTCERAAGAWLERARAADAEDDRRLGPDAREEPPAWLIDRSKRNRRLKDTRFVLEEEAERRRAPAAPIHDDEDEESTRFVRAMPDDDPEDPRADDHPLSRRRGRASTRLRESQRRAPAREPDPPARPPEPSSHRRGAPIPRRQARAPEPAPAPQPRRGAPRAANAPDTFMANRPEAERVRLIETMIATAYADGDLAAIEERRIETLIRILRLDVRARQHVFALLRDGRVPHLPTPEELPDYDVRLHVFEQAAIVALCDGVIDPGEHKHLRVLANVLELDLEDAKDALRRANDATDGRR